MRREIIAKCEPEQLEQLIAGYGMISRVYEDVMGGPSKAMSEREYVIMRQAIKNLQVLRYELAN